MAMDSSQSLKLVALGLVLLGLLTYVATHRHAMDQNELAKVSQYLQARNDDTQISVGADITSCVTRAIGNGHHACIPCDSGGGRGEGWMGGEKVCLTDARSYTCAPGYSYRGRYPCCRNIFLVCDPCEPGKYQTEHKNTACYSCPSTVTGAIHGWRGTGCSSFAAIYLTYSSRMGDTCVGLKNAPCHGATNQHKLGCISTTNGPSKVPLLRAYSSRMGDTCTSIPPNTCHDNIPQHTIGYVWTSKTDSSMIQLYTGYSSRMKDQCLGVQGTPCHDPGVMHPINAWMYPPNRC